MLFQVTWINGMTKKEDKREFTSFEEAFRDFEYIPNYREPILMFKPREDSMWVAITFG